MTNEAKRSEDTVEPLVRRVAALEQALSIALQYVPMTGDDADKIYQLEKDSSLPNNGRTFDAPTKEPR